LEYNVPFQHKYGYIRDDLNTSTYTSQNAINFSARRATLGNKTLQLSLGKR